MNRWMLVFLTLILAGCLKTRSEMQEVEQRQALSQTVSGLQKDNADATNRFNDVNEAMRESRGRIEVVENRLRNESAQKDRELKALADQQAENNRKMQLLQETIARLEGQVQAQNAEMAAQKAELAAAKAAVPPEHPEKSQLGVRRTSFQIAMDHFEQKDWKKAILAFQEYREKNPNGKQAPEAAYRIGVAFQELGLKDEAKTFFEEVISKYASAPEAKKAKLRLKNLRASK